MQFGEQPHYSDKAGLASFEIGLPRYNRGVLHQLIGGLNKYKMRPKSKHFESISVLDFGAGTGTLADLCQEHYNLKPDCLEIDPILLSSLREKSYTTIDSLKNVTERYDWIYCSNVLEHIEDDFQTLNDIYSALNIGGKLAIFVPAFQILFSDFDNSVGHYRRYGKNELKRKVSDAGFKIQICRYHDSLGFAIYLVSKIMGRHDSGLARSSSLLRIYDRFIYPLSRVIDQLGFRFLLGKNLVLIAQKHSIYHN